MTPRLMPWGRRDIAPAAYSAMLVHLTFHSQQYMRISHSRDPKQHPSHGCISLWKVGTVSNFLLHGLEDQAITKRMIKMQRILQCLLHPDSFCPLVRVNGSQVTAEQSSALASCALSFPITTHMYVDCTQIVTPIYDGLFKFLLFPLLCIFVKSSIYILFKLYGIFMIE